MMKKKAMLIILMILMTGAFAITIYIPADYSTIQDGLDVSENGDEIIVSPGTYIENINFAGKAVILGSLFYTTQDTSYISQTIIDGNQDGSVVTFESGEDSTSVLTGFTITNGQGGGVYPDYTGGGITCINYSTPSLDNVIILENSAEYAGGGIYCNYSSPGLENVTITGNTAEYENGGGIYCNYSGPSLVNVTITGNTAEYENGGGICCYQSSPSLDNVMITDNSAGGFGGGIYCNSISNPSLDNVTITGNSAEFGGGIYCNYSSPGLSNVNIMENSVENAGGGIYCNYSSLSLENVEITGNTTESANGGGIYCFQSSPSLDNVMITDNSAGGFGGGIYCNSFSSPSLDNVTITGNSAIGGGGIFCYDSSLSLENVIITDNTSGYQGGGIYFHSSSPSLDNVTITSNSAVFGGGIFCSFSNPNLANVTITANSAEFGGGIFCTGDLNLSLVNSILWNNSSWEVEFTFGLNPKTITIAYSDIDGGEGGIETHNNGTVNWLEGNIDADPLFVDALVGDYHLSEGSPCIDTGTSYFEYEGEVLVDLSEDEYYGSAPDMGAYESPFTAIHNDEIESVDEYVTIYPNPFNPETSILFELFEAGNVLLEIYNIKGQKVTTLVNEPYSAGSHKITWNAADQSSGVYLLRFITAENNGTKKLILLK
jgi:predicted outer membrane repeat protein